MTAIFMKDKASEMKALVEQGLHIFGKVMNICEQMCEDEEMGERGYYGHRDMGHVGRAGMREYPPMYPMNEEPYGERRGTGRYSIYR